MQERDYTSTFIANARNTTFDFPISYMVNDENKPSPLGAGGYGEVVKVSGRMRDGRESIMAVKKFIEPFGNYINAQRCYREIKLLQLLDHPNIVKVVDLYTPENNVDDLQKVYLVTKYSGYTVAQYIREQTRTGCILLQIPHIKIIIHKTVCALNYLYSAGIVHRDLTPSNITISEGTHPDGPNNVTLIDFGMARIMDANMSAYVCTRPYRAPEISWWTPGTYDHKADIWSLGCILGELITWQKVFPTTKTQNILDVQIDFCGPIDEEMLAKKAQPSMKELLVEMSMNKVRQDFGKYFKRLNLTGEKLDGNAINFLENTLQFNPDKRLKFEDALAHPFLADEREKESETTAVRMIDNNDVDQSNTRECKRRIWREIQNFRPNALTPV